MSVYKEIEFHVADEGSFAEYAASPGSATYTTRLPAETVTIDCVEERIEDASLQSRMNKSRPGMRGPRRASLDVTFPFVGHMSSCSGSITANWLEKLIGDGFGGTSLGTGTTIASATTAAAFVLTATGSLSAGQVARVGEHADARGGGHPFVVGSNTGGSIVALEALPAAPTGNDIVYACATLYPTEAPTVTKRFFIGHTDSGNQRHAFGCQLARIGVTFPLGATPKCTLGWDAAYWDRAAVTVPSVVSMQACDSAPCTSGRLFYNTVGTSTSAVLQPWDVNLSIDLGLVANPTPGGVGQYQTITSFTRTKCVPTITMTVAWSSTLEDLWNSDGSSAALKHMVFSNCVADGRVCGFVLEEAFVVGPRPNVSEMNEQTAITLTFRGTEYASGTDDITKAAVKLFVG